MGKCFLLWIFCCCSVSAFAQDTSKPKTIIAAEAGSPGIGLAAEFNHGRAFTVEAATFLGPSYDIEDFFLAVILTPSYSRPAVRFSITPRFYINMQDRLKPRKHKYTQVDLFLGLGYSYVTSSFNDYNQAVNLFTLHLGFRQFFSPRSVFTAHAGLGYAVSPADDEQTFYPAFGLKVGYRLNR